MRLELSEAISLILAIPAHRSHNDGHRKMGEKSLEFLLEYKTLGRDEGENAFNRAMISAVLSTVRAFSVERDKLHEAWKAKESVKKSRERLLEVIRNLSPLTKGNYWAKAITIIIALGFTPTIILNGWQASSVVIWAFLISLIILEILSKVFEHQVTAHYEKQVPEAKLKDWQGQSLNTYREIVRKFIDEALTYYKQYSPECKTILGYSIEDTDKVELLKEKLIELHFYL